MLLNELTPMMKIVCVASLRHWLKLIKLIHADEHPFFTLLYKLLDVLLLLTVTDYLPLKRRNPTILKSRLKKWNVWYAATNC